MEYFATPFLRPHLFFALVVLTTLIFNVSNTMGIERDKEKEKQFTARFWNILLRSPRRGAAFDRIYGYYADAEEVDTLLKKCEDLAAEQTNGQEAAKSRLLLGLVYQRQGKPEKAVEQFEQATLLDSDNALAFYYLAEQYVVLSRPQNAVQALEDSVRRNPSPIDLREILLLLVHTALQTGDTDRALAACNRLKQLFDNDLDILLQLAGIFDAAGHRKEALNLYRQAAQAAPTNPHVRCYLIEALIQSGEIQKAIDEIHANDPWVDSDDQFELFLQREIRALRLAGKMEQVLQVLTLLDSEQAPEKSSADVRMFWRLAAYLQADGKMPLAIEAIQRAVHLATELATVSKNPPSTRLLLTAARLYEQDGNEQKAIEIYEILVKLDGILQIENRKNLARLPFKTGQVEAGLETGRKILDLEELVETAFRQEDYTAAVRYQEMICRLTRQESDYNRLFVLYDLAGERDKALRLFMPIVLQNTSLATRLESIDRMIGREEYAAVDRALAFLEIHEGLNWEVPYRRIAMDVYENREGIDERVREFCGTDYPKLAERESMISGGRPQNSISDQHEELMVQKSAIQNAAVQDAVALLPDALQEAASRYSVAELYTALERQRTFLPTLFQTGSVRNGENSESRNESYNRPLKPFFKPESLLEARFFAMAWLLKSAWNRDREAYYETAERLREELPQDSQDRNILLERIRLEWLLREECFQHGIREM